MSKHDALVIIKQIYSYSTEIITLTEGRSREDLDQDRLLNLAVSRLLEIIGEAANRMPDDFRLKYPHLPWLQMIGLRNRLIHGYDQVDFDILWMIIRKDIPELIILIEDMDLL
jgi:uncharacterized protein with HEPN domain